VGQTIVFCGLPGCKVGLDRKRQIQRIVLIEMYKLQGCAAAEIYLLTRISETP
jgi:hypothetical protein